MCRRQISSKIGEYTGLGCHDFSAYRTSLDSSALLAVVLLFDGHEQL